jgi:hypothetical protein
MTAPPAPLREADDWLATNGGELDRVAFSDVRISDPCANCAAFCCTTLTFPLAPPTTPTTLDYIKFALGFPGTEVIVSDSQWLLAIKTRCRHLTGNRCGVFGSSERPIKCQFFDAWTCGFKPTFGPGREAVVARVSLEHFGLLAGCCSFDETGAEGRVPSAAELHDAITSGWHPTTREHIDPRPDRRLIPLVDVSP